MSVNVGQRNVPDTASNRQLVACETAMNLVLHTIKICSNKNIFNVEYKEALTDGIIKCAKDIYIYAWNGNNVYVTEKNGRWVKREELQLAAISKCNELLALINIARRLFHLKGRKVRYWTQLTVDARGLIRRWHDANADRYGK